MNNIVLEKQMQSIYSKHFIDMIIMESFCSALPFGDEEIKKEFPNIINYAQNVLNRVDTVGLLNNAMESATDVNQKRFLGQFAVVLEETVKKTLNEKVKNKKKDELEYEIDVEDMIEAASKIGTNEISKIIKDKVVATITDEKVTYDNAEKLKDEIAAMVADNTEEVEDDDEEDYDSVTDDGSDIQDRDAVVESILTHKIGVKDPRNHISFFSKLMDISMESIRYTNEPYTGEIPYETMAQITMESTVDIFANSQNAIEEIAAMERLGPNNQMSIKPSNEMNNSAMIMSICILTLLETLKTYRLYSPSKEEVIKFIDKPVDIKSIAANRVGNIQTLLANLEKTITTATISEPGKKLEAIERLCNYIDDTSSALSNSTNTGLDISETITYLETLKRKLLGSKPATESIENIDDSALLLNAELFDMQATRMFKKLNVDKIEIVTESADALISSNVDNNKITIIGKDKNNRGTAISSMNIYDIGLESYGATLGKICSAISSRKYPLSIKYNKSGDSIYF